VRRLHPLLSLLLVLAAGCAVQVPDVKVNLETPPLQRKAIGQNRVAPSAVSDVFFNRLLEERVPPVGEARKRQGQRRADLDSLEARGVVGESSVGTVVLLHPELLHSSLQRRRVSKLVEAENRDRKILKAWLETLYSTSLGRPEVPVSEELARIYREQAPPGTWLQTEEETWVRKEK